MKLALLIALALFTIGCSGTFEQPQADLGEGDAGCSGSACVDGGGGGAEGPGDRTPSGDAGVGGETDAGPFVPECGDGIDNDGDGLVDLEDDQCDSVIDPVEGEEAAVEDPPGEDPPAETGWTVVQRTNFGGPAIDDEPAWGADNSASPTDYVVDGTLSFGSLPADAPSLSIDPSVSEETPIDVFTTTRFDQSPETGGGMSYEYPAEAGEWRVRLHFAELWTGAHQTGVRRFDVAINGELVLEGYDIYADVGAFTAATKTFDVELAEDGLLDVEFLHVDEGNNPYVAGIELLRK